MKNRPIDYAGAQEVLNDVVSGISLEKCCECRGYDIEKLHPIIFPRPEAQALNGKLSIEQIKKLKASGWTNKKIARHFKVSEGTIRRAQKHENAVVSVSPTNGQHPNHPYYYNQQEGALFDFKQSRQYLKLTEKGITLTKEQCIAMDLKCRKERTIILLNRLKKKLGGSATLNQIHIDLFSTGNDKDLQWYDFFKYTNYRNSSHKTTIDQALLKIATKPEKLVFTGSVKF